MRVLADSVIIGVSLTVGVLFGLLSALGASTPAGPSELVTTHARFLISMGPPLGLVLVAMMSLCGVYRKKPALTRRQKVMAVAQSVSLAYALLLAASYFLVPSAGTIQPVGIVLVSYALNLCGSIGARSAKCYVDRNFDVHPKDPKVEKPVEKVLVIGGAGYIGSVLVRRLLQAGYQVRVLDLLIFGDGPIRELYSNPRFELVRGDFRHVDAVIRAVRGMDAVIHLGAIVGDPACAVDEETTLQTNYAATALVTEVCKGYGVFRLVFASTCSVYGASDEIVDEESGLNPVSLYAATKIDSEQVLLSSHSDTFHPTILRLGTAFGWSHRPRFDLVVNLLTAKAFFEKKVVIYNEEQWRPFVHVNDIARAFLAALEAPLDKVSGETFNVGSQAMNHRLGDVGKTLHGTVSDVTVVREANADIRNYRVSFDKIRTRLGFECETDLEQGIREIHQGLEAGQVSDYTDSRYHNHKSVEQNGSGPQHKPIALELVSNRFSARPNAPGVFAGA
jgi:nucleoside-diphosphate-sugar epimerase